MPTRTPEIAQQQQPRCCGLTKELTIELRAFYTLVYRTSKMHATYFEFFLVVNLTNNDNTSCKTFFDILKKSIHKQETQLLLRSIKLVFDTLANTIHTPLQSGGFRKLPVQLQSKSSSGSSPAGQSSTHILLS